MRYLARILHKLAMVLVPVLVLVLSGYAAQAERSFLGAPQASEAAFAGTRVAANASVPRTHGPSSKQIIDFATSEPVGTATRG